MAAPDVVGVRSRSVRISVGSVGELHAEREQRVTPLELFFDLVFVFAFTQVTTVLSDNPTWSGLGHALLILGALWWARRLSVHRPLRDIGPRRASS